MPSGSARRPGFALLAVAAVFILGLIRLIGFVQDNAVDLLFEDQWAFLTPMFKGEGPWASFEYQHGPHRLGLGGLIEWFLYRATGWDVRADAWAAIVVLAVATAAALVLAARLRGRLSWSDAAFPLLLLGPLHWETMTFTPSLAHSIVPLALVFLLACAWTLQRPAARVIAVGVCSTLVIFTGYGVCAAPAAAGLALLRGLRPPATSGTTERWPAVLILLLLAGAVVAFACGYHWDHGTSVTRPPALQWWDYPRFCALMYTSLLGFRSLSPLPTAAGAAVLGLVLGAFVSAAGRLWRREADMRAGAVWLLTGTSLAYAALTALGRLPINIEAAFMWRYMTLMTPGIGGVALALEWWGKKFGPAGRRGLMVGWVVLGGIIWANFSPERNAATIALGKRRWIASYLQTRDLSRANRESGYWVFFEAPDSPRIAEKLRWLEQRHLSFFRTTDGYGREKTPPVSPR
ncbi:MAG TPA: hypothetical protein VFB27_03890 [Opitutaceae bacterium]|nr:hypothetical protein [Opitutaceae bacterium]